jgi:16S rRNA (cytosine967-C5)-methyltransferase
MNPDLPFFRDPRHDARSLALQVLLDCRREDAFVQELLDRRLSQSPLTPPDRRLATELTYGVLRRRGTLFALLRPLITRAPQQVEPWLWDVLGLGAYQLAFLHHVPAHAALHETVELAARFGRPAAKGFLNGVLRALSRLLTDETAPGPAADALPVEEGRYRRLARPVLPDPAAQPAQYLSNAFALPQWLAERWLRRFPEDECRRLGFWFAGPAPMTLRCNPLRVGRDAFLAACAARGIAAEPGSSPQAVRLRDPAPVRELPGFEDGWFAVQDETSMAVAAALAPAPGSRVLDLCAAPGGKATHLAELMGDEGLVVACDVDERRLRTVEELARRLGLKSVRTGHVHPDGGGVPPGPFDAVLVDASCSNTGVLGRRPEVRWRLKPDDLRHLTAMQTHLLRLAVGRVRPGGAVVYSTCSIEPEENRGVIEAVLGAAPGVVCEAEQESMPGRPADGGYWARCVTRKETP